MNKFIKSILTGLALATLISSALAAKPQVSECSQKALIYFPESRIETIIGRPTIRVASVNISGFGDECSFVFDNLDNQYIITFSWEEKSSAEASALFQQLTNPILGDKNGVKVNALKTSLDLGDESVLGTFQNFHKGYNNETIYARKNNVVLNVSALGNTANRAQLDQIIRYALSQIPSTAAQKTPAPVVSTISYPQPQPSGQNPASHWWQNWRLILPPLGLALAAALVFIIRRLRRPPLIPPTTAPETIAPGDNLPPPTDQQNQPGPQI